MNRGLIALVAALAAAGVGWVGIRPPVPGLAPGVLTLNANGHVERIEDGDTLIVALAPRQADVPPRIRVRLHGIDAPELVQSGGSAARDALRTLTQRRHIRLDCYKADPAGRAVCRLYALADNRAEDVELRLLELGQAWHYRAFIAEQPAAERVDYAASEAQARAARRGLWQAEAPMPPWLCRERLRAAAPCD
jgi:endonuclease YncB( thermonuclease family)